MILLDPTGHDLIHVASCSLNTCKHKNVFHKAPIDEHAEGDDGSTFQSRINPACAAGPDFWYPCFDFVCSWPMCILRRQDSLNQAPLPGQHPEAAIGVFPDHVLKSRTSHYSGESKLDSKYVTQTYSNELQRFKMAEPFVQVDCRQCSN